MRDERESINDSIRVHHPSAINKDDVDKRDKPLVLKFECLPFERQGSKMKFETGLT